MGYKGKRYRLASSVALMSVLLVTQAQAQDPRGIFDEVLSQSRDVFGQFIVGARSVFDILTNAPDATLPPRGQQSAAGVARLMGRLSLNGTALEIGKSWVSDLNIQSSTRGNTVFGNELNLIFGRDAKQMAVEHKTGATFESRQSAWVVQLRAVDRAKTVTTNRDVGGTLLGFKLDFSLTGRCFLPGSPPDGYCTYTPGMATVPAGVNPDTLVPNVFQFETQFGEEIPQAVHDSLKADGFQRGEDVPGAALVGIHLDMQNSGFEIAQDPATSAANRSTDTQRRQVLSIAKIDQTISSNSREAAAARTTRAFVALDHDEWTTDAFLMQFLAPFLPAATSHVAQTDGGPNTAISNNLFIALNNAREPANSFTIFQTGRAQVTHGSAPARSAAETPVANYFGMWMGLSPVRSRTVTTVEQYIPVGERVSLSDPIFRQGGGDIPFSDIIAAQFYLHDSVDQSISQVNFLNIDDIFVQVGLDVTTQQAIRRMKTTDTSQFRLVPHLAIDGNRTGGERVLSYYAGTIFGDEPNAYVGADLILQTQNGWNAFARLNLYSAPDQDYFSQAQVRVSRTLALGSGKQFTYGIGAFAGLNDLNHKYALTPIDNANRADLDLRLRDGAVDYTLRQRFTEVTAGDWTKSTTLGMSFAKDHDFFVSAQVTPLTTEQESIQAAAEMNWRLGLMPNREQLLQVQLARISYDLGQAPTGANWHDSETTFSMSLKARF
ncbi:MAG: hypothetical protein WCO04_05830 [Pseudomonadota bacterium]